MIDSSKVAAVVLAAGPSNRFGSDKLLHPLGGKALAAHIADTLAAMPLGYRIAVCPTGNSGRAGLFSARGFEIVDNADPGRGLASSLSLGARRAMDLGVGAMLVCLADMPNVTGAHLTALIEMMTRSDLVATGVAGTRSPPAIFASYLLPQLAELSGDQGARRLLQAAKMIDVPPDLAKDFDTLADFD